METVQLGFIGTGPRGQGVIRYSLKEKRLDLQVVCDKFEEQLSQGAEASGKPGIRQVNDHRIILDDDAIDAVYICVEPENNARLVIESLNAGKHVMCDVPLGYSLDDCWQIVAAVEKSGKVFQLGEQIRYSPFVRAWKGMVDDGTLGKPLFVEGQYIHGRNSNRYYQDSKTGERVDYRYASENPDKVMKSRSWRMTHPILYLPHELSPILHLLDDRVRKVSCMSAGESSNVHDWFPIPDFECALMRTEKDTVLRLATGFTAPTTLPYHWYHLMGTKGRVETNRYQKDKMKMWLAEKYMKEPAELEWEFDPSNTPPEALASGHGGVDYYPFKTFADAIIDGVKPHMDVYKAADSAAPAIIASISAENDGQAMDVPDFRPNAQRPAGIIPNR